MTTRRLTLTNFKPKPSSKTAKGHATNPTADIVVTCGGGWNITDPDGVFKTHHGSHYRDDFKNDDKSKTILTIPSFNCERVVDGQDFTVDITEDGNAYESCTATVRKHIDVN